MPLKRDGKQAWKEHPEDAKDSNGMAHWLARGKVQHILVLSHSCELDKMHRKALVLVAPIARLSSVSSPEDRRRILEQKRRAFLPLPDLPGLGDCYADLRASHAIDRTTVDLLERMASLTDQGAQRLGAQVIGFFTRLNVPDNEIIVVPD
ncbi:MAG TPA: hypothetical protein PKD61_02615 [Polyangiaceae bacterium]|nr:hypothetical protein [Polyangiaceae bacterium]